MDVSLTAAVLRQGEVKPRFETIAIPELRADEVLVRLSGCGICHADILARDGKYPMQQRPIILGHEGSGFVERVGAAVQTLAAGDPVVLTGMTCGECRSCLDGEPFNCWRKLPANFSGRRLDGSTALRGAEGDISGHFFGQSSFATYSVANERNAVKVRRDAPIHLLGPLGCGIQTGAGAVFNIMKPRRGQSVAVFGGGGVGLSAVLAAMVSQCGPIVVVEPNEARRSLAIELGATHVLDPTTCEDVAAAIKDVTAGGVDKVLDTSGRLEMMTQAWRSIANGGDLVLVGSAVREAAFPVPVLELVNRGITVHGGASGYRDPKAFIPFLVDLFVDGRFPFDRLVKSYSFENIEEAIEDHEKGRAVKPLLVMG